MRLLHARAFDELSTTSCVDGRTSQLEGTKIRSARLSLVIFAAALVTKILLPLFAKLQSAWIN